MSPKKWIWSTNSSSGRHDKNRKYHSSNSGRENGIINERTNNQGKNANANIVPDMSDTIEGNEQNST